MKLSTLLWLADKLGPPRQQPLAGVRSRRGWRVERLRRRLTDVAVSLGLLEVVH
jgi:hypothetical protein